MKAALEKILVDALEGPAPKSKPGSVHFWLVKHPSGAVNGGTYQQWLAQRDFIGLDYTNWRRERAPRLVVPEGVEFASTTWHPEPQWLLKAWDVKQGDYRQFAMADIHAFIPFRIPKGVRSE